MIKRVNKLEEIAKIIGKREPTEIVYDLGQGKERIELLVTSIDEGSKTNISHRITSSPLIRLYQSGKEILMDITDSNKKSDAYSYNGLAPKGVILGEPKNPGYELPDLEIDLGNNKKLGISPYFRSG